MYQLLLRGRNYGLSPRCFETFPLTVLLNVIMLCALFAACVSLTLLLLWYKTHKLYAHRWCWCHSRHVCVPGDGNSRGGCQRPAYPTGVVLQVRRT